MKKRGNGKSESKGIYFKKEKFEYISTGCTLLDTILGGGFPLGQAVNLIGDSNAGKTLIATEVMINFLNKYDDGLAYYHEGEASFKESQAADLGLDTKRVIFVNKNLDKNSLEVMIETIKDIIKNKDKKVPCIYVVDSYDSLVSEKGEAGKGYNSAKKAGFLADFFSQYTSLLSHNKILLLIVSQERDNITEMKWGKDSRRAGGRALKFYSIQEIWLAEIGKVYREIRGDKRAIGLKVAANVEKNQAEGFDRRVCKFFLRFGWGIDDLYSNLEWLKNNDSLKKYLTELGFKPVRLEEQVREAYESENSKAICKKVADKVSELWLDIEAATKVKAKKY